jgi:hypothetical protein
MSEQMPPRSGSRWEPWPDGTVSLGAPVDSVRPAGRDDERDDRRRRWPLVALLVSLLTLGAGAGGVVAVRALTDPSPATSSQPGTPGDRGTRPDGLGEGRGPHHGPRPDGDRDQGAAPDGSGGGP